MQMLPDIPGIKYSDKSGLFIIAGPCVVESEKILTETASRLKDISDKYEIPMVFKASYRKANRSRLDSFSGIGDQKALELLASTGRQFEMPVITDIHNPDEAETAAKYADILQIPAFLCRQTDLLVSAARTGKWINVKKGQFLSGESMKYAAEKLLNEGNNKIILTDRGNMFGYTDLVVDMRNIPIMKKLGYPVVMDITHSQQKPNQPGGISGGDPGMIETIGRAAVAAGADGIFIETHPRPSEALSDAENMLHLDNFEKLAKRLKTISLTINNFKDE